MKSTLPGSVWPPAAPLEGVYAEARRAFPSAILGGGMFSYVTELNRKRPPAGLLDSSPSPAPAAAGRSASPSRAAAVASPCDSARGGGTGAAVLDAGAHRPACDEPAVDEPDDSGARPGAPDAERSGVGDGCDGVGSEPDDAGDIPAGSGAGAAGAPGRWPTGGPGGDDRSRREAPASGAAKPNRGWTSPCWACAGASRTSETATISSIGFLNMSLSPP